MGSSTCWVSSTSSNSCCNFFWAASALAFLSMAVVLSTVCGLVRACLTFLLVEPVSSLVLARFNLGGGVCTSVCMESVRSGCLPALPLWNARFPVGLISSAAAADSLFRDSFFPSGDSFFPAGDSFFPAEDSFFPGGDSFFPGGDSS